MAHKTYSPADVNISFSGVAITGWSEDDFLTMSRNSPLLDNTTGADGKLVRTKIADRTGTITISLAQTAYSNHVLSAISRAQELAGTDIPIGNFVISDPSGSVLAVGINAALTEMPEITLGATATNSRDWVFHCEILEYTSIPADIAELLPEFSILDGVLQG